MPEVIDRSTESRHESVHRRESGADNETRLAELEKQLADIRDNIGSLESDVEKIQEELGIVDEAAGAADTASAEAAAAAAEARTEKQETKESWSVALTKAELEKAYPGKHFELLSDQGSSGDVFYDAAEPGVVYKVGIQKGLKNDVRDPAEFGASPVIARQGRYMENEAAKLKAVADIGLGPKFFEFIQSRAALREKKPLSRLAARLRGQRTAELPIIKMGRIDFDPDGFENMPEDQRQREFERVLALFETQGRYNPGDVEFVVDRSDGRVKMIDAGGLLDARTSRRTIREDVESHFYPSGR